MNLSNLINEEVTQEEYLRDKNATLLFRHLPCEVGGMIFRKNDISVIVINDNYSKEDMKKAFFHELTHLELDHTYQYNTTKYDSKELEKEVSEYSMRFD